MTPRRRAEAGIVLPLVLIIGLLLSAAIVTFVRRAVVDRLLVGHRDDGAAAEALAHGGVQLGLAVLFEDRLQKQIAERGGQPAGTSFEDLWSRLGAHPLATEWGGALHVRIESAGARLNLNALVPATLNEEESRPSEEAEEFLVDVFERLLERAGTPSGSGGRDARELARNLLDYLDRDSVALDGRDENEYYRGQDPPYTAANRPLLSVDEVAMIEGFDAEWVERLRPYFTVYPLAGDAGIDVNTAPPHVLGLLYHGSAGDMRLADAELVSDIVAERDAGKLVCTETERAPDKCVLLSELLGLGEGSVFPPVDLPALATVFTIVSEASVGDVVHSIEAVVDLQNGQEPRLLSWRSL